MKKWKFHGMMIKLKSFTLIETMIGLFISSLCLFIIYLNLNYIKIINKDINHNVTNEFHLSSIQLNTYLGDNSSSDSISSEKIKIYDTKNSNPIFLEKYNNRILRVRGISGGYMPLFMDINKIKFQKINADLVKESLDIKGKNFETYLFIKEK